MVMTRESLARGNDMLLPSEALLLHIGPPKTGTTAVQGALKQARRAMAAHGVHYPGEALNHSLAARAVLGDLAAKEHPPADPKAWDRLVRQVADTPDGRVVVSSEFFSNADDRGAHEIASGLGRSSIHVVVTLRGLLKVLPSNWQQNVRSDQLRMSYEDWLVTVLGAPPYEDGTQSPSFQDLYWHERRRDDVLVQRWASVVGVENVTVVVADESDPTMLMRVFERMLGLPRELLQPARSTNTSLTFGEVELLRQLNVEFHRRGWSSEQYRELFRAGPLRQLQRAERPRRGDRLVRTPTWAAERICEIGRAAADRISCSGVRIVGDIAALGWGPSCHDTSNPPQAVVSAETAMQAVVGVILAVTNSHE